MTRTLKWIGLTLIILLLAIQLIRPPRTNPVVDESRTIEANTQMNPEVASIFERACYDCHSSKTRWPWYSQIAPVSWFLVSDVNDARKKLSLSDWGSYDQKKKATKLQEICEEIEKDDMPLTSYVLLHPQAKLSGSDRKLLCDWAKLEGKRATDTQAGGSQ
jgi:hypothetical protein